jgi:hypothetical protein
MTNNFSIVFHIMKLIYTATGANVSVFGIFIHL